MAKKLVLANLGSFTDTQVQLLRQFKNLLAALPDSQNISLNLNPTAQQDVSAQQVGEDLGLTITLTTPLGTISFSIGLDLPIEDLLNMILNVVTAIICAIDPELDICS
ncbi:hypothetical protein KFV09_12020 [Anoxybacillus rupiensis]|uniref:hypothetical protein n=1 Tax=Anoxybacteroides rupiense TaxID=311460 RepID=UPI001BA8D0B6|nr:hypothetical protein [Anoxybacillus rupiensis]MBS2772255.1 hypothetical protein [Anoxybacillus rupiensis]